MNLNSLTQVEAATLLGISPRTLRDWADVPRDEKGNYPGPALVSYFVLKQTGETLDLNKERARLAKEQADRTSLANAVSRGDVIPSSRVVQQWTDHIIAARARLLSLPTKVGPQLVAITDVNYIAETIKSAVYEALDELAQWRPSSGSTDGVGESPDVDGEPVGGRTKAAKQRVKRGAGAVAD